MIYLLGAHNDNIKVMYELSSTMNNHRVSPPHKVTGTIIKARKKVG